MNILELFERGGPLMWAILAASIAAVTVLIDRLWATRNAQVAPRSSIEALNRHLEAGDVQRAIQLCRETPSVLTRVIEVGLRQRKAPRAVAKEAMEEMGGTQQSAAAARQRSIQATKDLAASVKAKSKELDAALSGGRGLAVTTEGGRWVVDHLSGPEGADLGLPTRHLYEVTVYKPGYHLWRESVVYDKGTLQVEVTLYPDAIEIEDVGNMVDTSVGETSTGAGTGPRQGE